MKNKRFYSDKDFEGKFPEPGIPADEAWNQMHELLIKNNLTVPVKKDRRRRVLFFALICLFIGMAGLLGYIFLFKKDSGKSVIANNTAKQTTIDRQTDSIGNLQNNIPSENKQAGTIDSLLKSADKINDTVTLFLANKDLPLKIVGNPLSIESSFDKKEQDNKPVEKLNDNSSLNANDSNKANVINDASSIIQTIQNTPGDSVHKNDKSVDETKQASSKNTGEKKSKPGRFHFGLQWNINFSVENNNHYFEAYNGGKQYYVWALPSVWAKMDIGKKHGLMLHVNPYSQLFAGNEILNIEKPFIASVEPDIVTRLIKSRGYNFGLRYEYNVSNKISFAAGLSYTIQHNALYLEQAVERNSGNILYDSMYAAKRNEASFKYLRPSYLKWDASAKYNFKKFSIGAGVSRPVNNLSSNPDHMVRPLNGELYLQYRFK